MTTLPSSTPGNAAGVPFTDVQAADAEVIARQRRIRGITEPTAPTIGLALVLRSVPA